MATGKLTRFFKMAGMTASVAGRFAGVRLMSAFLSDDAARHRRAAAQTFAGGGASPGPSASSRAR